MQNENNILKNNSNNDCINNVNINNNFNSNGNKVIDNETQIINNRHEDNKL